MRAPASIVHAAVAAVLLTACTTTASPPMPDPVPPPAHALQCNAEAARAAAIGQPATAEVVERARTAAGAQVARVLRPGQMVTMEYREGRLNIDVDGGNVIVNLRCG